MIYVMSDIHGNLRRFNSILRQIRLQEEDTLYILGDVIDRHPDGLRILRTIMSSGNMKMLLGNHEYMMLRALGVPYEESDREALLDPQRCIQHWYRNGGGVTHRHWKYLRKTLRAQIIEYLHSLPLNMDISVGGVPYKLVHGAPEEQYVPTERYKTPVHFAVWRRWEPADPLPGDYTMIFGHTPTKYFQDDKPMTLCHGKHRIGIDCGGGYPEDPESEVYGWGRLACLRLDDMKIFYSKEPYESQEENHGITG